MKGGRNQGVLVTLQLHHKHRNRSETFHESR